MEIRGNTVHSFESFYQTTEGVKKMGSLSGKMSQKNSWLLLDFMKEKKNVSSKAKLILSPIKDFRTKF